MEPTDMDRVRRAVASIAAGKPVVLLDGQGDAAKGSLVSAAYNATQHVLAFTVRHTTGFLQVPLAEALCDRLNLPPMAGARSDGRCASQRVSVDARDGVTTGISASDRATTARLLADPNTTPDALTRPGHIVPIRVADSGLLCRHDREEASVDLAQLAELPPAAVLSDIVSAHDQTTL
ncbi:MAG: bifunctional 3,4-dihydroxy-2-butanone-4-phosphate synthase/GTP cyclohydrolase II, partial [Actinophytocola sp.]|nr:bifunctional 3,4-dihydroxy-2-butanone-4-phosphate synthase/GTP cyclohydrolase II [Actinophytocola sp.]